MYGITNDNRMYFLYSALFCSGNISSRVLLLSLSFEFFISVHVWSFNSYLWPYNAIRKMNISRNRLHVSYGSKIYTNKIRTGN